MARRSGDSTVGVVAEPPTSRMIQPRSGQDTLPAHPDWPGASAGPVGTGTMAAADGTGAARAGRAAGAGAPSPRGTVTLDGVGGTGLTIAAVRARETARPDRLFADPLAATFAEAGGLDLDSPPGGRRAVALRVWVVGRTVFLDELLAGASQQGCRQVVLLGAGFDARAFRLPWPAGTRCFEVDTPDVLGPKDEVLAAAHAEPACERVVVPCDLRDDWPAALRAAGLDPARPTAWIAEGLLVYLSAAHVDRLLASVTRLSAPGSWLGLTMTTREADGLADTRLATLRQSRAPDDPVGWLAGLGWAADLSDLREVLRAHGRPLPERPGPERRGAAAGARPAALLIRATLDPGHGQPAAGQAGLARADPREAGGRGRADPGEASHGRADPARPARAVTGPSPGPAGQRPAVAGQRPARMVPRPTRPGTRRRPGGSRPIRPARRGNPGGGTRGRRSSLRTLGSRPCCRRRSSRSRSSSTTNWSGSSRTGRPGARRGRAAARGWCH